jgi:hypothetical protein
MSSAVRWRALVAFLAVLGSIPLGAGRAPQRSYLDDVLDRAAAYVVRFEKECSAVVAEERYLQELSRGCKRATGMAVGASVPSSERGLPGTLRSSGIGERRVNEGPTRRELLSDILLVQLPDESWTGFRDIAEVDGRAIRNRTDRLQALFLKSPATLKKIQNESTRYNIGPIERTMNLPTFALIILHPTVRGRFAFRRLPDESMDGVQAMVVGFTEDSGPTIIRDRQGRDLPSNGRFWIEPSKGTVLRSQLVVGNDRTEVRIETSVGFTRHAEWGLYIPTEMHETCDQPARPNAMCVIGTATYTRFRRFDVKVDEKTEIPK